MQCVNDLFIDLQECQYYLGLVQVMTRMRYAYD